MYDVQAEDHHFLVFSRVRLVAKPRYSTRGPWLMNILIQSKKNLYVHSERIISQGK